MTPAEMETLLRTLDARTLRIEQILPTLATKTELARVEDRLGRVEHRLDGVEGTQHRLLILMEDTRDDVRLLAEHVATALDRIQRHP